MVKIRQRQRNQPVTTAIRVESEIIKQLPNASMLSEVMKSIGFLAQSIMGHLKLPPLGGTLIRNKNLESNFLTLGIRFQFKVPHLGEGLACVVSSPFVFKGKENPEIHQDWRANEFWPREKRTGTLSTQAREGFEFNVSHQTKSFKPSEVKNMCLHLTSI